jgi:hypothetical protein
VSEHEYPPVLGERMRRAFDDIFRRPDQDDEENEQEEE